MPNKNDMPHKSETVQQRHDRLANPPERYFLELTNGEIEECNKADFDHEDGKTRTERHTLHTNGANQICHTKTL